MTGIIINDGEQYYTDLKEVLTYADGNSAIWTNPVKIQHPMADIEIIAWDSSATVVIAKDDELIRRIKDIKPEAIGLEEYNGSN